MLLVNLHLISFGNCDDTLSKRTSSNRVCNYPPLIQKRTCTASHTQEIRPFKVFHYVSHYRCKLLLYYLLVRRHCGGCFLVTLDFYVDLVCRLYHTDSYYCSIKSTKRQSLESSHKLRSKHMVMQSHPQQHDSPLHLIPTLVHCSEVGASSELEHDLHLVLR
jgi:hypothetical protein